MLTSASELRTFYTCPAKWYYSKNGYHSIELDKTALYFGSAVHNGIAQYMKEVQGGRILTTRNSILEAVERHLREIDGDPRRIDKIIQNVTDWEMERLRIYGKDNMRPLFVEKRFDIPPFKGYVDCVFQTGKEKSVIIVDWKTGSYRPDEWMNIQLSIYSYFLQKSGYHVSKALIIFVEHGMRSMGIDKMDDVLQMAHKFFKRTSNPDYHYPKSRGWWCKWCEFQLLCGFEEIPPIRGLKTTLTTENIRLFRV